MQQLDATGRQVTLIHFVTTAPSVPSATNAQGAPTTRECVACMPNMVEFGKTMYHPVVLRTNDPRAATCPQCKKTDVFLRALKDSRVG